LESRNFWPHWVLGRTLQEAGNHAAAELAFNAAIALEPRYARGYEQRALTLAKQWTATGDDRLQQRARTDSRRAGQLALGDPSIYWPRGELLDELGETGEALNAYCLWLELEKDILGTVARGSGVSRLYKRANAMLADRRMRSFHGDACALLALIHWISGEPPAALEMAEKALETTPGHRHALGVKGVALLEMGKPDEALANGLEPACAASPRNFWMRLHRARALEQILATGAALKAWQELLAMEEDLAQDRCPPWIRDAAEEAVERLRQPSDDPRQLPQTVSTSMVATQ
jgi:tetratricopeptide (TPR) repeat protein